MSEKEQKEQTEEKLPLGERIRREAISWMWVILAFLFIHGTMVQARVIPSGSMERTLLVGDHLLVSRFGYDAEIPFTGIHWTLWREPERQQIVVFRRAGQPDFVKRIIGMPGDTVEIRDGAVWINGQRLREPYVRGGAHSRYERYGPLQIPPEHYFVMGDNRGNSSDSRAWGLVSRRDIVGTPLIIYLSVDAPDADAWQPGHLRARVRAYLTALVRPHRVRWSRLFDTF